MKKFFAVVVCCALVVTNVSAQEGVSVVEASSSDVVLASAQEPAADTQSSATDVAAPATAPVDNTVVEAPATHVSQEPAAVEGAAAQVVEGAPMVEGTPIVEGAAAPVEGVAIESAPMYGEAAPISSGCNGCGGGTVTSYAAPIAAPMVSGYAVPAVAGCAPAATCCSSNGGYSRPQVIRGFSSRVTSFAPVGRVRGLISRGNGNCCN